MKEKIIAFFTDVVKEMSKVTWPRKEELQESTMLVLAVCLLIAGFVYVVDRKKDMIISGGENIYPAELENILAGCPEVQEAAVIGVASQKWGETPLAIVVAAPGTAPTADSLKAYCKQHMAGYKVPQLYELVPYLPRNPSGKLLKPLLREQFPGPAPF